MAFEENKNERERTYFIAIIRKIKASIYVFCENNRLKFNVSDRVIIQVDGKYEVGVLEKKFLNFEVQKEINTKKSYKIIRKCTEKDNDIIKENLIKAKSIIEKCNSIILVHNMKTEMKIVDIELIFGGDKFIIYYTSEDRVDFRELLKSLNKILVVKVQMVQIGVRDEVKIKGSLGQCGNVVCCRRFLKKIKPVVINTIKEQELVIKSNKISGVCQRLMCCVEFESEVYKDSISRMPSCGTCCMTPYGKGKVEARRLLKEEVDVELEDGTKKTLKLNDIKFEKHKSQ